MADLVFEIWGEELPGVIGVVVFGFGVSREIVVIGYDFEGGFFGSEQGGDGWREDGV